MQKGPRTEAGGPPTLGGLEGEQAAKETEREGSERQEAKRRGDLRSSCPLGTDGHPHFAPAGLNLASTTDVGPVPDGELREAGPGSVLLVTTVLSCNKSWCAAGNMTHTSSGDTYKGQCQWVSPRAPAI